VVKSRDTHANGTRKAVLYLLSLHYSYFEATENML